MLAVNAILQSRFSWGSQYSQGNEFTGIFAQAQSTNGRDIYIYIKTANTGFTKQLIDMLDVFLVRH